MLGIQSDERQTYRFIMNENDKRLAVENVQYNVILQKKKTQTGFCEF